MDQGTENLKMNKELKDQGEGSSVQQLVRILAANPKDASRDLQYIRQEGNLFSTKLQRQACVLLGSRKLQEWLDPMTSSCLFAQVEFGDNNPISALSLVSSLLYRTLQADERTLPLHYVCGLHTDRHRDAYPCAEGMLQSLLVQLLDSKQENISLDFADLTLFQRVQNADLVALCTLFEGLINRLPPRIIPFVIVDGVSFYETQDRAQGTYYAIKKFIELAETAGKMKLLVTCPGISGYVRKGFRAEDILWVADAGDGNGDGFM